MNSCPSVAGRRIVLAAPPFCGHLHPILAIGMHLRNLGADCVVLTGPNKNATVEACGLSPFPVLTDRPNVLEEIANTDKSTTLNPVTMYRQISQNIALIPEIMKQSMPLFKTFSPELVIADFTAYPLSLLASQLGLPHISITPTPLAIENTDGTPSYLGGWTPGSTALHTLRDFTGRKLTRIAKQTLSLPFRAQLKALGIKIYREGGTESIYSNHSTLGLGMTELEFPRSWPSFFKMIGPLPFCPERSLDLDLRKLSTKPLVLVTAGTHVWWAKDRFIADTKVLRNATRDVHFVFSLGDSRNVQPYPVEHNEGFSVFPYVPYDQHLHLFRAVLHHGGSGVMYSCIEQGIPALVRPLDYDQFDYAARIEYRRLGIRVKSYNSKAAISGLRRILDHPADFAMDEFRERLRSYSPLQTVTDEAQRLLSNTDLR